ncbi:TraI/MobA(P) family conjugative relaxase [Burkholderia sp. PAMC 26561]|uniref:TraI/MobA(P) family conjugative relaxase n=1 Tax=Burkholderia sp. PAMC 26561 TaxID=1795043 RepID=UPI00084DA178|nr:TraI/MobA(P) family conjugative relaxase [Burkholderia sp. PAMC 26561]
MIVKKIKNPSKSASKTMRVNGLATYIASPEKTNVDEKCVYQGSCGFLTESFEAQKAEMLALAQEAVRSRDPINHYVMSWKENEHPSPGQVEEAVAIFLKEMGLENHQAIYGLHADTANLHLHLMVNRVHPDSLKVIKPNRGFDIEAAHRAIARIEHVQGWERERHGRYRVLDTGEVERGRSGLPSELQSEQATQDLVEVHVERQQERQRQPEQSKRDMEERTGEKSAERIAIEEAGPVLREAKSWAEVHRELANNGMRYEKVGSGAVVFVGEIGVKASRTDRAASLLKMEKRLGKFAPAVALAGNSVGDLVGNSIALPAALPETLSAANSGVARNAGDEAVLLRSPRSPMPIAKGVAEWPEYIGGRRAHYATKTVAVTEQKGRHLLERQALSEVQKATRRDILVNGPDAGKQSYQGVWKGKGELRQAMQSILAAEQAGERATLKDRHQRERELLRERFAPYPDFEVWLRERGQPELAERWRYRDRDREVGRENARASEYGTGDSGREIGRIIGVGLENESSENSISVVAAPRDIRNYVARIHGREVHYSRRMMRGSADRGLGDSAQVAFVDKGREIQVRDWHNADSLLAALQLSAQKWGELRVSGSDDYKARCAALAVEHGFRIVNPELQEQIAQGRQAKRPMSRKNEQVVPRSDVSAREFRENLPGTLADIYRRHYDDVIGRQERREHSQKTRVDPSRVDAMIAVRMRVTGHDQATIREALLQSSPSAHGRTATDGRDWRHYAERTTAYAFGPAGTRRLEQLAPYREKWERLEGRERGALALDRSRHSPAHEGPELERENTPHRGRRGPSLNR